MWSRREPSTECRAVSNSLTGRHDLQQLAFVWRLGGGRSLISYDPPSVTFDDMNMCQVVEFAHWHITATWMLIMSVALSFRQANGYGFRVHLDYKVSEDGFSQVFSA
ncbi:hypothetical protein PoB_000086900 [Plakobranchus ocellatus]|uniref:Uncharacterized protein n=1 Tax=Plakobranchus ocellatus TaxID=259542 RepID=A0AAV3XX80_9GAST|nr:hypothetical protein PoB_000086900 [Plakobranchus ocellatus]